MFPMNREVLSGCEAVALGAVRAGVNFISACPDKASDGIIDAVSKADSAVCALDSRTGKSAAGVAAGACAAGCRTMVILNREGLSDAAAPLSMLASAQSAGGFVVVSVDEDIYQFSSDSPDPRKFAGFAGIPVLEPSDPESAYLLTAAAFDISERFRVPVMLRATRRVIRGSSTVGTLPLLARHIPGGFNAGALPDPVFHGEAAPAAEKLREIAEEFDRQPFNSVSGSGRVGLVLCGAAGAAALSCLPADADVRVLRLSSCFPLPEKTVAKFLDGLDRALCVEYGAPVIEEQLLMTAGRLRCGAEIHGKLDGALPSPDDPGELKKRVLDFIGVSAYTEDASAPADEKKPALCPGCPHRASLSAVKEATKGRETVFCGDIGCSALGRYEPVGIPDVTLCSGASASIARGIKKALPGATVFAFIGDHTLLSGGAAGVAEAITNGSDMIVCVLDNSSPALSSSDSGRAPGPTAVADILRALGAVWVGEADPLDLAAAKKTVAAALEKSGPRAIVFTSPCARTLQKKAACSVDPVKCVKCGRCAQFTGCPAVRAETGAAAEIDRSACAGCGLCAYYCPVGAISLSKGGERQ